MARKRADRRAGSRWSAAFGAYPYTVRVFERKNGVMYAAVYDPDMRGGQGGERRRSLGHRNRARAGREGRKLARELLAAADRSAPDPPTVAHVFALHHRHRTPDKSPAARFEDHRVREMWERFLGPSFDLGRLSRREWDAFARQRRTGAIDCRARPVERSRRRPVRTRVVRKDLATLRAVCRWATGFRTGGGQFLLPHDPSRGLPLPSDPNPRRPVATRERVDAVRGTYRRVRMRRERAGRRVLEESYLPELFEIAVGTGRRISPVCRLREEDLDLERTQGAPSGAIVWPEDTDKMRRAWRCPVAPEVRAAIDSALRKRDAVGPGWLFPSPGAPGRPIGPAHASAWLRKAEALAGLVPLDGSLWHAYRRLWASRRKGLPAVDVAQAGGWKSLSALQTAYQQPDDETMLRVVLHRPQEGESRFENQPRTSPARAGSA